jgi:uncharacterized protein with PQ loop repeat
MTQLPTARLLVVIASAFITLGLYGQVRKIFCTKSAGDFYPVLLLALLANELTWLNYGLALREWPVILIAGLNLPAVGGALIGYWRFHKQPASAVAPRAGSG